MRTTIWVQTSDPGFHESNNMGSDQGMGSNPATHAVFNF